MVFSQILFCLCIVTMHWPSCCVKELYRSNSNAWKIYSSLLFHDCNCFVGPDGQLPKEKLSQLKQVLTSPFFNSVKEVYEHVYSTVDADSNSSPELGATATAQVSVTIALPGMWPCVNPLTFLKTWVRSTCPRCIHLACSRDNSRSKYFLFDAHYADTNISMTILWCHQNVL